MRRAALYLRVSTKGHGQTTDTQALALREYAEHRGFEIVAEYNDTGVSGMKIRRPDLDRLMRDARGRRFDVVLVARFDRFARSVTHLLQALGEFNGLGIDFVSLTEAVDTSTPMGKMIFTILGAVAELERNLITERVAMGIERARKQGKALGRPRVEVDPLQVAGLRSRGLSWNQIAEMLSIGRGTAERAFRSLSQKPLCTSENVSLIQ